MKNLMRYSFYIILQMIVTLPIICMEERSMSWDQLQNHGPLADLKFEEESVDDQGVHYGWLYANEFDDQIFVKVVPHNSGYYVGYVDPKYSKNLPYGLYYWKSTRAVKPYPKYKYDYAVKEVNWSNTPTLVSNYDYSSDPTSYISADDALSAMKSYPYKDRLNRYKELGSFEKSFNGPTTIYLIEDLESMDIAETLIDRIRPLGIEGAQYAEFDEAMRTEFLDAVPRKACQIFNEWLKERLKNSGLQDGDAPLIPEVSSELIWMGYVLNKQRVIDQYIIEKIIDSLRLFFREFSNEAKIDPYMILEQIEELDVYTQSIRKEFEEKLLETYGSWSSKRVLGMTAEGVICCCQGLLQWD